MEKHEVRAVIKFLHLKMLSAKDIYQNLITALEEGTVSYSLVKKWSARFLCGAMSTENDHHTGRPADVTSGEVVEKTKIMNRGY